MVLFTVLGTHGPTERTENVWQENPIEAALRNAGCKPQDLDELVLIGGATCMPMIQQLVREVAGSAAIRASVQEGEIKDVDKIIL